MPQDPSAATGIFAPDSVWTTPLPLDAPVDPRSVALIDTLVTSVRHQAAAGTGPALSGRASAPIYRVDSAVPKVPVELDTGPWGDSLEQELAKGVPIPPNAQPSRGSDGEMVVWQPSSDTYWEFFLMQQALHSPQLLGRATVSRTGGLSPGTYHYKVTAVNANGETSALPRTASAMVGASASSVTFRWSEIEDATAYRIYRGDSGSDVSCLTTLPQGTTTFTDVGEFQPDRTPPPTTNTARTPGKRRAAYGGVIHHASASPGYYRDARDAAGSFLERFDWGSGATSLPFAGGAITRNDLKSGRVDHALSIGLPNLSPSSSIVASGTWSFPAQRSDGKSTLPDAIPEGARLRLDPLLDLDSLHLSPFIRLLAVAAQRYGMVVQNGSKATVFYGEDPSPYERAGKPNFYDTYVGPRPAGFLRSFPWEHLQLVQMTLCTNPGAPCLSGH